MGRSAFARLGLAVFVLGGMACSRAAAAALLPTLDVRARAQRIAREGQQRETWDYALHVRLRFRRRLAASAAPSPAELDPALWLIPCDDGDVICFEEAQVAESELTKLLGGLP